MHDLGIRFNYIANSTILDSEVTSDRGRKKILDLLDILATAGIDAITISIPYLADLIAKRYPTIEIVASICCNINSRSMAKRYIESGVKRIVLPKELNRSIALLKKMTRSFDIGFEVLCNSPCLFSCPDLMFHAASSSLFSGGWKHNREILHVPCVSVYRCWSRKVLHREEYKSPWIRPEDCHEYARLGISYFKIDGRNRGTLRA